MKRIVLSLLAVLLVFIPMTFAQTTSIITTYAGPLLPAGNQAALTQGIDSPVGVAADNAGGFFVASSAQNRVYHVDSGGILTIAAGKGTRGFSGDGGSAIGAQLANPTGLAVDASGNLFIVDHDNFVVRRVTPSGLITTVAGGGLVQPVDNIFAVSARLFPAAVAVDLAGNLLIVDGSTIRRVRSDGVLFAVVGTGIPGFSGDGGPALLGQINNPTAITVDNNGNLFIADAGNNRIRKVTTDGLISTFAGSGTPGFSGDGGSPLSAQFNFPAALATDTRGNLFVADRSNFRIREITPSGAIFTVAGGGSGFLFGGDGGPAVAANLLSPQGVSVDRFGVIFIADTGNNRIRQVTPDANIHTVAGNGTAGFAGDGGAATNAELNYPDAVAVDAAGNLFIADQRNDRIRKVTPAGIITTVAGNGMLNQTGDGGPAVSAEVIGPNALVTDAAGDLFLGGGGSVREITPDGLIKTIAGGFSTAYGGDGGPALSAQFNNPWGLVFDASGNLFVSDIGNHRVRRIAPDGIVTTIAGIGSPGFSGDGGPATSAQLTSPQGLAVDAAGNLFIADGPNNRVRKVSPAGIITTAAGTGAVASSGDGGPATSAAVLEPTGLAIDADGSLFIAEATSGRIRKVAPDGTITTIVGSGIPGFSGDGGPAIAAQLSNPEGIALDNFGNLYIAEAGNARIRKVSIAQLSTLPPRVGSFAQVVSGGGWATSITLTNLSSFAVSAHVSFYTDSGSPLTLPLTFPNSNIPSTTGSSADLRFAANQSVSIEIASLSSSVSVGWADVYAPDPLEGYAVFGQGQGDALTSEATVPLDTRLSSSLILPYDNTSGLRTGIALANQSASAQTISVAVLNQLGTAIGSSSITLQPFGHASLFVNDLLPATANNAGVIEFSGAANITGVGLLFYPSGGFTSLPIIR